MYSFAVESRGYLSWSKIYLLYWYWISFWS